VAEARVALVEARTEAAHAAERAKEARKIANRPGATHPQREVAEAAEKRAAETAEVFQRADEAYSSQVKTINIAGVTLATVITVPSKAEAAREEAQQAEMEARIADEALAHARGAVARPDAGLGELVTVAGAAFKAHVAEESAERAYDNYVEARVDERIATEEAAKVKAEQEAEARAEAYLASTPEGLAWEGMKIAGSGLMTGLHYAEEGAAYVLDAWGRYGMGLPVDVGHGALAAQDAAVNGIITGVELMWTEANPAAPLMEERDQQAKAAERLAEAAEIRDQDEIDKLAPTPTIITIPDESGKKDLGNKDKSAVWTAIEKPNPSVDTNICSAEEEPNMSVDPSLQSNSSTVPRV
jgi:hypothetical protein